MARKMLKHKWKTYGDKNNSTFHNSLKIQQMALNITSKLNIDGGLCSDPEVINDAFLDYFTSILGNTVNSPILLNPSLIFLYLTLPMT